MRRFTLLSILAMLAATPVAWSQAASQANEGYKTKDGRDKVAKTLDNPNRDKT